MIQDNRTTFERNNLDDILRQPQTFSKNHINCFIYRSKARCVTASRHVYNSYLCTNIFDVEKIKNLPGEGIGFIYSKNVAFKMLNMHMRENRSYIYMDNSYFSKFYDEKVSKFRFSINHIHPQFRTSSVDILNSFDDIPHNITMKPWQEDFDISKHILICPPTGEVLSLFNLDPDWLLNTVTKIRENTDRKIIIRFKEKIKSQEKIVLEILNSKYTDIIFGNSINRLDINKLMENCYAVVAPASGVGVIAVTNGIPVFSESFGPVAGVASFDYTQINNPIFPNREPWLKTLLLHEFTLADIHEGVWLGRLKKLYPKKLKMIQDESIKVKVIHPKRLEQRQQEILHKLMEKMNNE